MVHTPRPDASSKEAEDEEEGEGEEEEEDHHLDSWRSSVLLLYSVLLQILPSSSSWLEELSTDLQTHLLLNFWHGMINYYWQLSPLKKTRDGSSFSLTDFCLTELDFTQGSALDFFTNLLPLIRTWPNLCCDAMLDLCNLTQIFSLVTYK